MNPFGLPETDYKNINCYNDKERKIVIPEGYIITNLTIPQLKKIDVPTAKCVIGYRRFNNRRYPNFANLIRIEDVPKTEAYTAKIQSRKDYGKDIHNWLYK